MRLLVCQLGEQQTDLSHLRWQRLPQLWIINEGTAFVLLLLDTAQCPALAPEGVQASTTPVVVATRWLAGSRTGTGCPTLAMQAQTQSAFRTL